MLITPRIRLVAPCFLVRYYPAHVTSVQSTGHDQQTTGRVIIGPFTVSLGSQERLICEPPQRSVAGQGQPWTEAGCSSSLGGKVSQCRARTSPSCCRRISSQGGRTCLRAGTSKRETTQRRGDWASLWQNLLNRGRPRFMLVVAEAESDTLRFSLEPVSIAVWP